MSRNVTDHHIIISHTAVCLRFWKIGQWLNAGLVVSDWRWPQRSGAETDTDWWHRLTDVASFRRELKTTGMDLPNTIVNSWAIQVPKPVNEWTSYTVPVHQWRARTEANSSNRSGNAHTHTLLAIPKITRRNRKCILTNEMHPFRKGIAIVAIYRLQGHILSLIISIFQNIFLCKIYLTFFASFLYFSSYSCRLYSF